MHSTRGGQICVYFTVDATRGINEIDKQARRIRLPVIVAFRIPQCSTCAQQQARAKRKRLSNMLLAEPSQKGVGLVFVRGPRRHHANHGLIVIRLSPNVKCKVLRQCQNDRMGQDCKNLIRSGFRLERITAGHDCRRELCRRGIGVLAFSKKIFFMPNLNLTDPARVWLV